MQLVLLLIGLVVVFLYMFVKGKFSSRENFVVRGGGSGATDDGDEAKPRRGGSIGGGCGSGEVVSKAETAEPEGRHDDGNLKNELLNILEGFEDKPKDPAHAPAHAPAHVPKDDGKMDMNMSECIDEEDPNSGLIMTYGDYPETDVKYFRPTGDMGEKANNKFGVMNSLSDYASPGHLCNRVYKYTEPMESCVVKETDDIRRNYPELMERLRKARTNEYLQYEMS